MSVKLDSFEGLAEHWRQAEREMDYVSPPLEPMVVISVATLQSIIVDELGNPEDHLPTGRNIIEIARTIIDRASKLGVEQQC